MRWKSLTTKPPPGPHRAHSRRPLGAHVGILTGVRAPGVPQPATITITTDLDALEGRLGALPGVILLPNGPFPLSLEALRRMGCDSRLDAVLLDAARTPVGASGTHRHATEKERRAVRALWGDYCVANGCSKTDTVPHHVPPWWKTGRTERSDLVPLCKGNPTTCTTGTAPLRLRDGRLIDEHGWVDDAHLEQSVTSRSACRVQDRHKLLGRRVRTSRCLQTWRSTPTP